MLPDDPTSYDGVAAALWFAVGFTALMTGRSLIHIFRRDGGAQSIAGIDVEADGGQNLIAIFAQWGLVQLLLAALAWIVLARYPGLLPLLLTLYLVENLGRIGIGWHKPAKSTKRPPGAIGSVLFVPILAAALAASLL